MQNISLLHNKGQHHQIDKDIVQKSEHTTGMNAIRERNINALETSYHSPIRAARRYKIILSGPFCTGKTSLIQMIQERWKIDKIVDDTTRTMRNGEREGFPYHFISEKDFLSR